MKAPAGDHMKYLLGKVLENADAITNATETKAVEAEIELFEMDVEQLKRYLTSLQADISIYLSKLEEPSAI